MASGTGPLSPDFSGIDPDLMQGFVAALERGRDVIGEQSERIRQLLATAQVPAAGLQPIREIKGWIDDELPELRKRNETIKASDALAPWLPGARTPGSKLVGYDEGKILSPAEAQKQGTALGKRFLAIEPRNFFSLGNPSSDAYMKVVKELADHKNDADYTAAFFAALGTKGTVQLPALLRENLDTADFQAPAGPPRPDDEVLRTVSQAFGTAVTGGSRVPGFAKIKEEIRGTAAGAGAGLLLSAGRFPAEWLRDVVLNHGFADPKKVSTGFLYALGNNPGAARQAIAAVTGPYGRDQTKLKTFLKSFNGHFGGSSLPPTGGDDAFGRMLAAASGAYDEEDGKHSQESAAFAFTVMTTLGKVGEGARVHLAEIAGAYATEITEGANIGDANMTEPSALKPSTSAFGLKSAFTLSPKDTYRFLKLFADSPENLKPFDEGMGRFSQKVIADASAKTLKTGDVEHLDRVFTALGNVRGFELAAVEKVQGNLDTIDKQRDDLVGFIRDTAIGAISMTPVAAPNMAADLAWFALSTTFAADGAFGDDDETRVEKADKQDAIDTLGRQHTYAQILMANGFAPKVTPGEYQAKCPPGVAIADANGELRPFADLMKQGNKGLEAFEKWAAVNGMGGDDRTAVGRLSGNMANSFDGGNKRGRERSLAFDS
ncbi:hypothetical protein GCM10027187_08400 [Streptosporangium sandarakinum]|uniref:Uncharacterized protein n=1 Tax=Streptosporangium sandarakinum TaxID=1260955 RepID=A0A852V482_9ACTN|nr:DUF6571 family protein [Streptosporangium sandarakinum]NYF42143.1 hypothetical protein [Streptosporangium sandarakinum]